VALAEPDVSSAAVSSVPPERMGVAAGVNGSIRELGGVLGVAAAATVFAHSGGDASTATFTSGFIHAICACAVLAGLGIAAALLAEPARPSRPAPPTGRPDTVRKAPLDA
jgi:hypothetical protein